MGRDDLAVGLLGLVPAGLDALPQPAQDTLGLLGGVEVVQPPLQRRPVLLAALGVLRGQRLLQAGAGVGADIVQPRERRQRLFPGGRRTIRAALAQQQGHAGRFHADQARLTAKEDLVQGHRLGTRAGHGVQGGEHAAGLMLGGAHPMANGGAVGGAALGQEQSEGVLDLVEAQPQGVQGNGHPSLLVPAQLDAVVLPPLLVTQLPLEILELVAQIPKFAEQLVAVGPRLLGLGDGLLNPVGVFVGSLAAASRPAAPAL